MKKIYIIVAMTFLVSILVGLFGLFGLQLPFIIGLSTAETFLITALHVGICILFAIGFQAFKAEFKRAYIFISAGILLLAAGVLQYTILGSVNAFDSLWVTSGAVESPFVFSILASFAGLLMFARLIGVPHLGRYLAITLGVTVVLSLLATLIPSPRTDIEPYTLWSSSALYMVQVTFLASMVVLAYRIRTRAGALYIPMFAWLFTSYVVYVLQMIVQLFSLIYLPVDHWYIVYGGTTVFFVVAALFLLKAAIELNRIRYVEPPARIAQFSFYGRVLPSSTNEGTHSAVDAVIYLAGLVSSPAAIEPILNGLRAVTSGLQPGQKLSAEQQQKLAKVYRAVEDYLVNKEPIGKYTQADLRERVVGKYQEPTEGAFWSAIKPA